MLSVITPLNDGAADDLKTALPTIGDWLPASFYMMDPITMNVVWPDREAESGSRRPNLAEALRNANTPERIAAIEVAMEQVLKLAPGQTHEFELPQVPEGPIDPVSGLAAKPTSMLIYRHMGLAAPAGQSTRILGMVQERPIAPAQPRPSSASRSLSADHLAALVRLASGTVHQINNKLGSIMAADSLAIELLREGGSKEETLELLGDVREEAKRCGRIVSELFAFLDPDSDHGARPRFDEMAMHARQLTRHDAERHGARVVVSEAPALPPMKIRPLHAKLLLAEVMRLLMTAGSQHIDLSARLVEDDRIRIEFFGEAGDTPIDLTRVDGDQSMIAICRSIAEEYGGNVLVESVDERQAIIAILVPVE